MAGSKIALALLVVCIGALHVSRTEAFPVTEVMGILRSPEFERQLEATITQLPRYKDQLLEVYKLVLPAIERALRLVRIPPSIFFPRDRSSLLGELSKLTTMLNPPSATPLGTLVPSGFLA